MEVGSRGYRGSRAAPYRIWELFIQLAYAPVAHWFS
jgi:hypothetical protein